MDGNNGNNNLLQQIQQIQALLNQNQAQVQALETTVGNLIRDIGAMIAVCSRLAPPPNHPNFDVVVVGPPPGAPPGPGPNMPPGPGPNMQQDPIVEVVNDDGENEDGHVEEVDDE